jgi:hypothetical protein
VRLPNLASLHYALVKQAQFAVVRQDNTSTKDKIPTNK